MKRFEELGISPVPWKCATDDNGDVVGIENGRGFYVARFAVDVKPNDARIISASPKLYECLHDAIRRQCQKCHECRREDCKRNNPCYVKEWRAALAEAAGESEAIHGE